MVFEDVHWSDPTTRESLDLLVDRMPSLRVLVIVTYRPEFTPPWVGHPQVTLLSLNRLPPRQRGEMIASVTGGKALPKEIADQIIDRTDGVPLFIEELTKAVVESGLLVEAGDRYVVTGPVTPLGIPASLQGSLLARLDRLAPTREVAQIAAALGRQFSHELISAVATIPEQQLDNALAQLVHAELIFRRGTPPDAEYTFKHALVQDAAYGTLLRSRRQWLNARIATTLESQFPEIAAAQPTLLAQHCAEADLIEKAIDYRLKAAQRAIDHSAMTEAEAQLRKGFDLLARMPEGTEHQQYELDLHLARVKSLSATQGFVGLTKAQTLTRARQLCEQLDRPTQLALVLSDECEYHVFRVELALACKKSKELLDLADARNDPALKLRSRLCCAMSWINLGEFVATRAYAEYALALCDPAHPDFWIADSRVLALLLSSGSLNPLGHLDHARSRREQAIALARQRDHAFTLAVALATTLGQHAVIQSDPASLLLRADEVAALSAEHGFAQWIAVATSWRGWCLSALGRTEEGLTLQTEALAAYRATGTLLNLPAWLTRLADAYMKAGRVKEGLKQLDEATDLVEATQERISEAEVHRLRGDLLNTIGDRAAAELSYHQALAVAKRQSAKLFELRAATSLARLWRDQGKRDEAGDVLAPVYGWFTEGLDTPVLQNAKTLLEKLAA